MAKSLGTLAISPLTMSGTLPLSELISLFRNNIDHDHAIVAGPSREPLGLITRLCAFEAALREVSPCTAQDLMISGFPVFNASDFIAQAFTRAAHSGYPLLENGAATVDDNGVLGFVTPRSLCCWLQQERDRLSEEKAEACRAWSDAQQKGLHIVAHMGHELRTPLNAVLGYAELIRDGLNNDQTPVLHRDYAATIYDASHHLLSVVNTVLDMAKVDARLMSLCEERIYLRPLIMSAFAMMRVAAEKRNVRLGVRIDQNLPRILVDPQILRQILINLLSNAIKFSHPGGRVDVHARLDRGGALKLSVKDKGIGIAAKDIGQVMKPFRQVRHAATAQLGPATGLGLPLVKSFVELHGGGLQILSAPEVGTKAVVTLPASRVLGATTSGQIEFSFSAVCLSA